MFWADRPLSDAELKAWLPGSVVDHAVFNAVQPIYIGRPIFTGGPDPVRERSGLFRGGRYEVTVPETMPGPAAAAFTLAALPEKLQKLIRGDAAAYGGDRSRHLWAVLCWLARLGWSAENIKTVVLNPRHKSHFEHCQEQPNTPDYVARQIEQAAEEVENEGGVWERNPHGLIKVDSQANIRKALDLLNYTLSYDRFAAMELIDDVPFEDALTIAAWLAIDERYGFRPNRSFFEDVLLDAAHRHTFHPVLDYLAPLVWDGVKRIDTWLHDYGQVENTEYSRAVGRLVLLAAVRRVRQPGAKFDEILVFVDPTQGNDKSEAILALCPNPDWFSDSLKLGTSDKERLEKLGGKWIVEMPELAGMRKGEVEAVKAELSRQVDRARKAYARHSTEAKRQCIFIGTTNNVEFLKDDQNRRFWPVETGAWDVPALKRDRDQLWAEAAAAEATGESIRLPRALWAAAAEVQKRHEEIDPWTYRLDEKLHNLTGRIKTRHVFDILQIPEGVKNPSMGGRLKKAMVQLGWEYKHGMMMFHDRTDTARGYLKGTDAERQTIIEIRVDADHGVRVVVAQVVTEEDLLV